MDCPVQHRSGVRRMRVLCALLLLGMLVGASATAEAGVAKTVDKDCHDHDPGEKDIGLPGEKPLTGIELGKVCDDILA